MKYVLTNKQLNVLLEQNYLGPTPIVVKLFNIIGQKKKESKNREELLETIRLYSKYFGIPKGVEQFLLESYMLNYRKDGDYSDLTKEKFIDPRTQKGKKTSNKKASFYTAAQLPFEGSNLNGNWIKDPNRKPQYVVSSYGWYPVLIFKDDKWYEVSERYSSSTGKQINNADPTRYDDELSDIVYLLTKDEMRMIINGSSHEDVMNEKVKKLKGKETEFRKSRVKLGTQDRTYDYDTDDYIPGFKVKFKINSVNVEDGIANVIVDVIDVLKLDGRKSIPTPENYLKGEMEGITKEMVEKRIKIELNFNLKDYIGKRIHRFDDLPEDSKIKYTFNHLKK